MLHPQAAAALAPYAALEPVTAPGFDIDARRRDARGWAAGEPRPEIARVDDLEAAGVPCRLYQPREGAPLIVYAHGGGFVFGEIETHDAHARRLAVSADAAVLLVDYRRPPEHLFPAASDDLDAVVGWCRSEAAAYGVDTARLAAVGDSAGGQLALLAAHRNPGAFERLVLVYPVVDPRGTHPSYERETGGLSGPEMSWYWQQYLGPDPDWDLPELHPTTLDLGALPPTLVVTGEHDPLRDEGEELAAAIASAGVGCVATRYLGMPHAFWRMPALDAARLVSRQIAAFLAEDAQ